MVNDHATNAVSRPLTAPLLPRPSPPVGEMATTAYSRTSKPAGGERRAKLGAGVKSLSKIEPKKLGVGLVAGCCLALLTYLSLAKLFSIYSPVFEDTTLSLGNLSTPRPISVADSTSTSTSEGQGRPTSRGASDFSVAEGKQDSREADREIDPVLDQFPEENEQPEKLEEAATTNEPIKLEEAAASEKSDTISTAAEPAKTIDQFYKSNEEAKSESTQKESKIVCDDNSVDEGFPYARPVVCEMTGDVRISPGQSSVFFVSPSQHDAFDANGERRVRPFARKDDFLMPGVVEVTAKSVPSESGAPQCTVNHDVPAVVFSVAGYTGNFFHDMADVLVPLFLTSSHFKGEVQYLVTNFKPPWIQRYLPVLTKLSNYDAINFDAAGGVHCFRHAFLGLFRDRDLIIYPNPIRNPRNYSMVDFTRFLRGAYSLKRPTPIILGEVPGKRPKMLIISRTGTRKLLNMHEVAGVSEEVGFQVVVAEAGGDVAKFAELVNSCDVLLAVHGAGLTNQVFLPTRGVLIQIVPWGKMDWMATNFYGQPARDMGLRYLEYNVSEEETTLIDKYPRDHLVFTNPLAIHGQGWAALADIIMKQDVKVKLQRFRPTLLKALDLLQE